MTSVGSSGQTSESRPTKPIFTNPLDLAFSGLFGQRFKYDANKGGFRVQRPDGEQPVGGGFSGQIFSPEMFGSLLDQLQPVDQSIFSQMATENLQGANNLFGSTIDLFQNQLLPSAQNIANTGLPTNLDPIIAQSMNLFNQEIVPELANQFGFLGGGGQNILSGDFGAALAREGGNIATDLGALQVDLDEASAGRQLEGLNLAGQFGQILPELGQLSAAFPAALGSDILALDEQNFDLSLLQTEGGQLMNLLNNLVGITQPDPILGQVSSGDGSSTNVGVL